MTTRFTRSTLALSGIFALSLTMAAPTVFAQEEASTTAEAAQAHLINPAATGSIVVHKYLYDNPTTAGTGNPDDAVPADATPLGNVPFTIKKVTLTNPLNTPDGFAEAAKLTADTAPVDDDSKVTMKTGPDGVATFSDLAVGVYLVSEDAVDSSTVTGLEEGKQITPAAPFLVFVPMTNPKDRSSWNYDVNVFPKNSQTGATKEVEDAGANAGDEVTWTIKGDIPVPGADKTLSKYVVNDNLDASKVEKPTVVVEGLNISPALTENTDYTVTITEGEEYQVSVEFTEVGLKKLAAAKNTEITGNNVPAPQVQVKITAKVLPLGEDGMPLLENKATVVSNNGSTEHDTTTNTDTVKSYFGKVKVNKVDEANKPLSGAKFQVFQCTGAAEDPTLEGESLTVNGVSEWTTDDQGTFTIDALHVTDFADNEELVDRSHYCLVETEAPMGYELLTKPVQFELTRADLGYGEGEATPVNLKTLANITNVESTSPNLPLTGGPGIIALVLAGLALIGGGAWYGLRSSHKA
ncbi:SpaH/EbpB family LPXTG-anchored major pilin [Corynebacterium spheniscorum]|uniref:Fimbrial isopeptide formation D2 domain-containing protein n=1 Tax=Corynebacterium spheniscorum TaxID=185761 RepID=A0A1I2PKV7_9CORY|nr:SpaH/EbpB family LPXTG-anchored major pilin [Corynebacterium spheniscorum]KAA8723759.1 SpaH/EbpB family LPXTG-anchored major pilin [Corynebacterium spheniscorum]SFG15759.1 fimbrial isopeptide formation D2 domain-containing protein [Corynebacterium spheniscorum]